jgi:predicted DsbA family dithiol-disulfide isomerase
MPDSVTKVTFYFDPICPFSYKTFLWINEVRAVRHLEIDWRFLSLQAVNEGTESLKESHFKSIPAFRVMAKARREKGFESVDRLYREIGRLRHEERKDISKADVLTQAVREAGLDPAIVAHALDDESTLQDLRDDHASGVAKGAFGVASIELNGDSRAFFGPVLSDVPTGHRAGELWDHFAWMIAQPEFYEIKRERH